MSSQTKRMLLSLTGLAVFLLLAFGSEYSTNKNSSTNNRSMGTNTSAASTSYVNSKPGFSGTLEENFVEFSFNYPSSWKRDPGAGKGVSPNFVKVEGETSDQIPTENFAVGYCTGPLALMPKLADQLSEQFSGSGTFAGYKKVSEGATKVAGLDAYEFRFTGHSTKTAKELDVWGRAVLLPSAAERNGAVLIMLATSASPDVHSVDDVGEKGELPLILKSFKFGS
ncbi:MAG TPA: hypothetical protein VN920_13260 [Pyrinomonadaceae bacterium]|nr:hypothetical protein [Pyrinomonadaceae bacterium]